MTGRQKFTERKIRLVGEQQKAAAIALLENIPLDPEKPLEAVFREEVKVRKLDQNALMWVGPLKDIEQQAWANGRQYSAIVWHEYFKELFLPEEFDTELTKEGYRKYDFTPDGVRVLVGSTTELTIKGFSQYLEQVHAFGANLGVLFHANPNDRRMAA
ncbi:hypothetical protein FHW67_002736 [Herbaspirillum sp. Sphag1AN]|uniref:recombination protein NinB n=1 Tax=unclassified Herbaspirillum TaxID=2624150 RepID=UPI00161B96D2|nr:MULTISPECIES: recombination protein NinB [unclassified Herbaspirillum]MBB3213444.1 hypothetical protein [Herbaspirillum sp. Sphag1AN]MBB3246512.1 hypothetical protein [Herbaspirillum sp. Sphag64]